MKMLRSLVKYQRSHKSCFSLKAIAVGAKPQRRRLSQTTLSREAIGRRKTGDYVNRIALGLPLVAASVTGFVAYSDAFAREEKQAETKKKDGDEGSKKKEPKVNYEKPQLELLKSERIILLEGSINDKSANQIVCKMLLLDKVETKPIQLYINCPGGKITSGLAIYDAMQTVKSPVHTYVIGRASSMAAVIAAAGEPGHRSGYENCRVMVHEASNGIPTKQVSDIILRTRETIYQNEVLLKLLSVHTKKSLEYCREHVQRDKYMSAQEAVDFGIFDQTIKTTSKL